MANAPFVGIWTRLANDRKRFAPGVGRPSFASSLLASYTPLIFKLTSVSGQAAGAEVVGTS